MYAKTFSVAEASFPSTGLGIELQIASERSIPIVLCFGDWVVTRLRQQNMKILTTQGTPFRSVKATFP